MQLLTSLIGGSGNTILNAVLALVAVLVLVVLALWALKLVMRASNNVVRGGNKRRLSVVDSLPVDGKRQLLIVRRDNVEHLILTGGPQDVVVETGIAVETQPVAARPIPTVRRQGGALPQRAPRRMPLPETVPPAPGENETPADAPLDRLRALGRAAGDRHMPSLRQTGLLRPVSRMEPSLVPANADNSIQPRPDSATTGRVMPFGNPADSSGQAFGDDDNPDGTRDEG